MHLVEAKKKIEPIEKRAEENFRNRRLLAFDRRVARICLGEVLSSFEILCQA